MPQLDGLRAIAVLAVMAYHYWPDAWAMPTLGAWAGGWLGVNAFFIISGFLITTILLRDIDGGPFLPIYASFLWRRMLRLYPALVLVLLAAFALDIPPVRESLPWHLLYLTNVYIIMIDAWPGAVSHLWSLAVEEQFYLLWPLVILATPRRWLPALLITMIVGAVAWRTALVTVGAKMAAYVLVPGSMDALALGALLAISPDRTRLFGWLALGGVIQFLACATVAAAIPSLSTQMLELAAAGSTLVLAWPVALAASGSKWWPGAILSSAPLRFVGIISYGVYLIHPFVHGYFENPISSAAASLALAALSFYCIERPIMRLGRRYGFGSAARLATSSAISDARLRAPNSAIR